MKLIGSFFGLLLCATAGAQTPSTSVSPQLYSAGTNVAGGADAGRKADASGAASDVKVAFAKSIPTILPSILIEGMPIEVQVSNVGSDAASGTVSLSLGGETVGTAGFSLASGEVSSVTVTMGTDGVVPEKKTTLVATASLTGVEDANPDNNTAEAKITVSGGEFAYDHATSAMYVDDHSLGLPDFGSSIYSVSFHVPVPVMLESISAAYGRIEGEKVGVYVWKWDADTPITEGGYYPMEKQVYFGTYNQGLERGQHEYALDSPLCLEPGDYMVGLSFYGYGLVTDLTMPNQMYCPIAVAEGAYGVVDWTSYNLGTPALRMKVGSVPASVENVYSDSDCAGVNLRMDGRTLVVDGGAVELRELHVYSLAGAVVADAVVSGNSCRYDLTAFEPGVYIVKVVTGEGCYAKKIMVE